MSVRPIIGRGLWPSLLFSSLLSFSPLMPWWQSIHGLRVRAPLMIDCYWVKQPALLRLSLHRLGD